MRKTSKNVQAATTSASSDHAVAVNAFSEELRILHIDVGQGEATLIMLQRGGGEPWVAIIDGGYAAPGRGALGRYLQKLNVRTVHAMICTHFDGDHTRGLTALIERHVRTPKELRGRGLFGGTKLKSGEEEKGKGKEKEEKEDEEEAEAEAEEGEEEDADEGEDKSWSLKIEALYVRNASMRGAQSSTKLSLLRAAERKKIQVREMEEGKKLRPVEGFEMRCVHSEARDLQDENEGSIALVVSYHGFTYYTAGDLPSSIEDKLDLKIDQLTAFKCGHHGSANSTSEAFLGRWKPRFAFISCGSQSFGHPTYDVIERLLDTETVKRVYLTNCIHNRKRVNPEYETQAKELAQWCLGEIRGQLKLAEAEDLLRLTEGWDSLIGSSQDELDKLQEHTSKFTAQIEGSEQRQKLGVALKLLKALGRALEHHQWRPKGKAKVITAGSATSLGTIAVCVLPTAENVRISIGCYQGETYEWSWHWLSSEEKRPARRREQESAWCTKWGNEIFRAIHEENDDSFGGTKPVAVLMNQRSGKTDTGDNLSVPPGTPVSSRVTVLPGSPGTYAMTLEERARNYHRFDVPTVVGLRAKEANSSPFIPFCFLCKGDGEQDEALLKVGCKKCSVEAFYHEKCYRDFKGESERKDFVAADLEVTVDMGENEVAPENCPQCFDKIETDTGQSTSRSVTLGALLMPCKHCEEMFEERKLLDAVCHCKSGHRRIYRVRVCGSCWETINKKTWICADCRKRTPRPE